MRLPAHPASPDPGNLAEVRKYLRSRSRPTAVDLFCGAGGLSLGLERAGFDVVVGADSDAWAVQSHAANLSGLSWCGDLADPSEFISALDAWGLGSVDLVAGGVPCQPFSRAGAPRIRQLVEAGERASHDVRADLWGSFVAVVDHLQPRAVLVENVPDLPRWNDGAVLISLFESLRGLGYAVEAKTLDGFRFGVPQHRQRLILAGTKGEHSVSWPTVTKAMVTLKDAIGDLPPIPKAQRCERLSYDKRRQTHRFQRSMRAGLAPSDKGAISDHISRDVRPDDMEAFRLLEQGQTYVDLPERLRRYRSDVFKDKYKRLSWGELSRSITAHIAKDGYWYIHPEQHRTLSVREAARIQTFPDSFGFCGSQTHRYRQIGNAVPVLLGEAVGRMILDALAAKIVDKRAKFDEFRKSLTEWHDTGLVPPLPWRLSRDPWHVLICELSLARARPDEASRISQSLLHLAPTPTALARLGDSVNQLRSLGLKESAETIANAAADIVDRFDGEVPEDDMELRSIKGVGDFVCQAVLSFGFGRNRVLLDSTTVRVASRIFGQSDLGRMQLRLDLHRLSGAGGPDPQLNQALLDLGRGVCVTGAPHCGQCPVALHCATGRELLERASHALVLEFPSSPTDEEVAA